MGAGPEAHWEVVRTWNPLKQSDGPATPDGPIDRDPDGV